MAASPPMKVVGIDHVDVFVPELEGTRAFFEKVLGAEVLGSSEDHAFLLFGDQVVGLRLDPDRTASSGVHHLALRVLSFEGLAEAVTHRGGRITEEKTRDESRSLFVEGPGGFQVELIHRPDPEQHPVHGA